MSYQSQFKLLSGVVLTYQKTPVQEILHPACAAAGVRLLVKREDMNHPSVSGNKWWKLKYNLESALTQRHTTVLTFGGAFSNHIYATAAAARQLGLASVGVIRGEEHLPLNPTLAFATANSMHLHYVSRGVYQEKNGARFIESLRIQFGDFFLIPEGGTNLLAVKGCEEFARHELMNTDFDHLFLAVGTGGTMAGLVCAFAGTKTITGISVLRDGAFLTHDVDALVSSYSGKSYSNWSVLTQYHEGGYARVNAGLLSFIEQMRLHYNLPLDHVYTAKMLRAVLAEIELGSFKRGTTILALHTGGLQGTPSLSTSP